MKLYTIIETVRYEIEAESEKDAEQRFLNAQPAVRDSFSVEVSDREVFESEARP